jgi:hypothetical protein
VLKNYILFFIVSIIVAIYTGIALRVDFKSYFGIGLTIGYWIFAGGIALLLTHLTAAIYWYVKRKRMPGVFGILWISWALLAVFCFIGNNVNRLE